MEDTPARNYIGPRKLSDNQYEKFKRYGIIGSDGEDFSDAKHEMRAKELMDIRSNKKDSFDGSFAI